MVKHAARLLLLIFAWAALFACSTEKELQLEVKATMDGKAVPEAEVLADGAGIGATDEEGTYSGTLKRKPGTEVHVSVIKNAPGYNIEPWEGSFVMKMPEKGKVDTYSLEAALEATKYITINVTDKEGPVKDAAINVEGKKVANTHADGSFVYEYKDIPARGLKMEVSKRGYATWRETAKVVPGQVLDVQLHKEAVLTVKALVDEYGSPRGLEGVEVRIGKRRAGKTNAKGIYTYVYKGTPGTRVSVSLSAPGHLPKTWNTRVKLEGRKTLTRYFIPAKPLPVRVSVYGYASNVPDEDVTGILSRMEDAVKNNLFSYLIFKEVPSATLKVKMRQAKVDMEKMTTKGWEGTPLYREVDAVIMGSVSRDGRNYIIETKAYASDGRLVLSQINSARGERDVKGVARKVVDNILRQFPFEGLVTARDGDNYRINLGSGGYKLRRGMEFALMAPSLDKSGRAKGYKEVGTLRVKKTWKTESQGDVVELAKGAKVDEGYKVVRLTYAEEEKRSARDTFVLLAKGGVPPDVDPLGGVNVYLDDRWAGTTGPDGKADIPVKAGKTYDLVLYRHGYQQAGGKVKVEKGGELKEYVLNVNDSLLKVESEPSGAKVYMDGEEVGRTPMLEGKRVNFGFHTLRLTAGGDFRDWEEVVEFNQKVMDLTGSNRIAMHRDYLAMAKRAREEGDPDAAIAAYSQTGREHPDYSEARFELAQMYMDEKGDYDSAIREFENVLSVPENEQLIYKQYAVTYTNLGHAYYARGNEVIREDSAAAAQHFANAIKNLELAKQNTRFLPTQRYDEAVHDTYYYSALSYHKLYLLTRKEALLDKADLAWREYFDFFPPKLEDNSAFVQMRDSAEQYWAQIRDLR